MKIRAILFLASCFAFSSCMRVGNVKSAETAKENALETLEQRYGIPFVYVENVRGVPFDMETYRYWHSPGSFFKEKCYGEKAVPQYYGGQLALIMHYIFDGFVEPQESAGKCGLGYRVTVTKDSVKDAAWAYFVLPKVQNALYEIWKNRPKDLPFTDNFIVTAEPDAIFLPKKFSEMSEEEIAEICLEKLYATIHIYLPPSGFWKRIQKDFIVESGQYGGNYKFSKDKEFDFEFNRQVEKLQKDITAAREFLFENGKDILKHISLRYAIHLDDGFMGMDGVIGTDIAKTGGMLDAAISAWTQIDRIERISSYYYESGKTREDSNWFHFREGNYFQNGRIGIKRIKRKEIRRREGDEESAKIPPGTFYTIKYTGEVREYADEIREEEVIDDGGGSPTGFIIDGSPIGTTLVLKCNRPVSGIIRIENGYFEKESELDYGRLKKLTVTNMANGKTKEVSLLDRTGEQILDLRDITEKGAFTNVYEFRIDETYKGKKWNAAAFSSWSADLEDLKKSR